MANNKIYWLLLFTSIIFLSCNTHTQQQRVNETSSSNYYQLAKNWPQLPSNFLMGNPTGIGIDTSDNIVVFHRADREWATHLPDAG